MENLVFLLLCFIPILIALAPLALLRYHLKKKSRAPFDIAKTLRVPGFTLLKEIKSLQFDLSTNFILCIIVTILPFAQIGVYSLFDKEINALWPLVVIYVGIGVSLVWKILKQFNQLQHLRLGLEAEWAVATELAHIKEPSITVFHDVQCDNFNIDHVVTSPNGVLAIETKGRRKPNKFKQQETHKVKLVNDALHFPNHIDKESVPQAIRQAKWLKELLGSSTGEPLNVAPALIIPGWYVEMRSKPAVLAWPLKKLRDNYRYAMKQSITPEQLTRVNHQLSLLCERKSTDF